MCEWCHSLYKKPEEFQLGDMVALSEVHYTYWGDGMDYVKYAVYCPFCGEKIQHNKKINWEKY